MMMAMGKGVWVPLFVGMWPIAQATTNASPLPIAGGLYYTRRSLALGRPVPTGVSAICFAALEVESQHASARWLVEQGGVTPAGVTMRIVPNSGSDRVVDLIQGWLLPSNRFGLGLWIAVTTCVRGTCGEAVAHGGGTAGPAARRYGTRVVRCRWGPGRSQPPARPLVGQPLRGLGRKIGQGAQS